MDGKPLYEYAREGKPLPRPIDARKVTVHSLELLSFTPDTHEYRPPSASLSADEKTKLYTTLHSQPAPVDPLPTLHTDSEVPDAALIPPIFKLRVRCSGGTYIRSLAHDLCQAIGSAGHLAALVRTKQGNWGLEECVSWQQIEDADKEKMHVNPKGPFGMARWEEEIMEKWEVVDVRPPKKNTEGRRERMLATSSSSIPESGATKREGSPLEETEPKRIRESSAPQDEIAVTG
jgi:tRNA pseudouridine55 synthase